MGGDKGGVGARRSPQFEEQGSKMEAGAGAKMLSEKELVEQLQRLKVSKQWAEGTCLVSDRCANAGTTRLEP